MQGKGLPNLALFCQNHDENLPLKGIVLFVSALRKNIHSIHPIFLIMLLYKIPKKHKIKHQSNPTFTSGYQITKASESKLSPPGMSKSVTDTNETLELVNELSSILEIDKEQENAQNK